MPDDPKFNPYGSFPITENLDLYSERGRPGTRAFSGYIFDEFLPSLSSWPLRAKTYREMLTNDPIIWAMFHTVEILCRQANFDVTPASDSPEDQKLADFVKEVIFDDLNQPFKETLAEWLTFIPWGWSWSEIKWKRRNGRQDKEDESSQFSDGKIGIAKFAPRGQDTLLHWEFDPNGTVTGLYQLSPPDYRGTSIPKFGPGGLCKSLHFHTATNNGSPEGNAVLRHVFRAWFMKQRLENLEGIGIERDAAGMPCIKIPAVYMLPGATDEQKAVFEMFQKIASNLKVDEQMGLVIPSDMFPDSTNPMFEVSLLSTAGQKQIDVGVAINRWNRIMLMVLLADFIVMGHEKVGSFALAQPVSSKVLTPSGWKLMGELKVGDEVVCPLGNKSHVVDTFEHGVKPAYRLTLHDGRAVRASADHRWVVSNAAWKVNGTPKRARLPQAEVAPEPFPLLKGYGVLKTQDLIDRVVGNRVRNRFHVPLCSPVEFTEQSVMPLDPYILGVLLGDGWMPPRRGGGVGGPTFLSADAQIIDEVRCRLPLGHTLRDRRSDSRARAFRISGPERSGPGKNQVIIALDKLGLLGTGSHTKFIPECYLTASIQDRAWLLRGLMDTDGYISQQGQARFGSVSRKLVDGVIDLVRSLGGYVSLSSRQSNWYRHPIKKTRIEKKTVSWLLTLAMPESIPPFHLSRKLARINLSGKTLCHTAIMSVEPDGEEDMRCIAVSSPSKMYVTDGFVPTHNSDSKTELFADACGGFLDHICDQITRHVIPTLLLLNGETPDKMPRFTHGDIESVDPVDLTNSILNLANAGVNVEPLVRPAINRMGYEVPEDAELMKPEPTIVQAPFGQQPMDKPQTKGNAKTNGRQSAKDALAAVVGGNGKRKR